MNHKKKISLRHPLPSFGSFSFFQASLWLGVDKVLQKLTKSYKNKLKHLFQCWILIPRKCPCKFHFSTQWVGRLAPLLLKMFRRAWRTKKRTIWIVYFRLKEKMNSAKAAGNSSMDFCLFLTQYATDDGRRQLCTVLALMNFSYDKKFYFVQAIFNEIDELLYQDVSTN